MSNTLLMGLATSIHALRHTPLTLRESLTFNNPFALGGRDPRAWKQNRDRKIATLKREYVKAARGKKGRRKAMREVGYARGRDIN